VSDAQPVHTSSLGAWPMYRSMVGVGLLCGLLIVTVFVTTRPVIRRNKAEALQRAIFQVLPGARSSETFRLVGEDHFEVVSASERETAGARLVHAGYDEELRLVGLAIEARGMGYQDVITVLYGYSFVDDAVIGIRVLESRETPGLGSKIETDPEFLENFVRLDVSLSGDGASIAHPIEAVKRGQKQHPWQIDGITGATISSVAITGILRRSTADWIPRIRRGLDDFRKGAQ
jgi:electron transport complex protein RnfG